MKHDLFTLHAWMWERWSWWAIIPITLFWAVLWPVGLIMLIALLVTLYVKRDRTPEGVAKRRAEWANLNKEDSTESSRLQVSRRGAVCWSLFALPLISQGIVPLIIKLTGGEVKALFAALYMPDAYQWPFIFLMIVLGVILFYIALKNTTLKPRQN